jgi:uncharacterized protein (DUF433 family)
MNKDQNTAVRVDEHGVYRVAATRVMLESVVYPYLNGQSPECIRDQYPALTIPEIEAAIAFFNANRPEVDAYLARQEKLLDELRRRQETENGPFLQKLRNNNALSSRQPQ